MATIESPHGPFVFPLEVIQLIVTEVSTQTLSTPQLRTDTLCVLSRVCQAFYFTARAELLSAIFFSTSLEKQDTLERADILVHVLRKNQTWAQGIRSMTLAINYSQLQGPRTPRAFTSVMGRLRVPVLRSCGPLTPLLEITSRSPSLEKFTLEGWDERVSPCIWEDLNAYGISTFLDEIHANSSLKYLKIANIYDIPWDLVLSPFTSQVWQELAFINARFDLRTVQDYEDHINASNTVSRIKILTLINLRYVDIFVGLRSYLPGLPAGMVSKSPSVYFTSLHTLRISVPVAQYDAETLAKFLLGVAGTLKTLDLRMHHAMEPSGAYTILPLTKLLSLKTLKIRADITEGVNTRRPSEAVLTFESLNFIGWALSSTSSLPRLTSIHIGLYIEITTSQLQDFDIRRIPWRRIDQELNLPAFAALRNVSLEIEKRHFDDSLAPGETFYKDGGSAALLSSILSRTYGRPSLEMDLEVVSVYSSERQTLRDYCRSL